MANNNIVSLITGGARGLGKAIVRKLSHEGHHIVLTYLTSDAPAHMLKSEIGENCHILKADVTSRHDLEEIAHYIEGHLGRLDNLINNAGIAVEGLLMRCKEHSWDRVFDINLTGCFYCMQAMVPLIERSGGGHVINISSYAGVKGKEGQVAYSASKAGLIGLGRTSAKELANDNIRINTILPGYMKTAMGEASPQAMTKAKNASLLKVLSNPDEVAGFISYLCSTKNITGQVFSLDSRVV